MMTIVKLCNIKIQKINETKRTIFKLNDRLLNCVNKIIIKINTNNKSNKSNT